MRTKMWLVMLLALAGLSTPAAAQRRAAPVRVNIIAFNDFHGALEPPHMAMTAPAPGGTVRVPTGGAAYLASAVRQLRAANPNSVVVAAGDLISASPLVSAEFLDEPTVLAMNLIGLDFASVGNHEFDRGRQELLRMQNGGCERHTTRQPCRLDRFPGARYRYLAANVLTENGQPLFPASAMRSFGTGSRRVQVGFIGLTLRDTSTLVTPSGVAGLTFTDEADSINAAARQLRAQGADAVIVLIHQGLRTQVGYNDHSCAGVAGDLLPVLARLDRGSVDVVVSGHTHNSYICDYGRIDPTRPMLVTSAEKNGVILTNISLTIDPARNRVTAKQADNVLVQGEGYRDRRGEVPLTGLYPAFPGDPAVQALVARYAAAAAPIIARPIGRLPGPALKQANDAGESVMGDLIADAFLAATSAGDSGRAQIAFTNQTSVRTDIIPAADGSVTFGQLFAAQPFGNQLVVLSMTGAQLRAVLEQQFASGPNTVASPIMLQPSRGFTYSYDLRRPEGQRVLDLRLSGAPMGDDASYRVAINSFLAAGGDSFTGFRAGTSPAGGMQDVDALERYIAALGTTPAPLPPANRITRLSPRQR